MRQATEADIPRLVEMGRRFHEAKQGRYEFSHASTAQFFSNIISSGVVLVVDDGFLAGVISGEPSNAKYLIAHEVFWWSEGRSGLRLRKAFETWAADMGCSEVQFSHPENETTVGRVLARAGYSPATQVWRKPCA